MRQNEGSSPADSMSGSSEKLLQSGGGVGGGGGEEVNVCDSGEGGVDAVEHLSLHGDTRSNVF